MLTIRQKQVLDFIKKYAKENSYSPSLQEIARKFKLSSVGTVHKHINNLKEKGYLEKVENHPRSIELKTKKKLSNLVEVPLLGTIAAGQPIEAIEIPETIEVSKNQLSKTGKHYALKVQGDSMIDEGIFNGDTVIIKKQRTANNGETVVALLNNEEVTLKKIYKEKNGFRLQPANPNLKPIFTKELQVQGKVISVVRSFNELQNINSKASIKKKPKKENLLNDWINTVQCVDCVEAMKRLPDDCIDLIFADPPYNLQLKNELIRPNKTKVDAVNDEWDKFSSFNEYDIFTKKWLTGCKRILKKTGSFWVIGSYHNIFRVGKIMHDLGFWILNDIIWIKSNPMPNFRGVRFTNAHETLIWATKNENEKKYTFNYDLMKKINQGKQMRSDWYFPICNGRERLKDRFGKKVHTTQKPLALIERIILASSKKNAVVLDPFAGTGTTGHAAQKCGRNYILIEKEEKYCNIIKERLRRIEKQNKLV